jgi:regulator of protease activity HflC (stomatin/prohibitin superfamily)
MSFKLIDMRGQIMKSYSEILRAYLDVEGFNRRQDASNKYTVSKVETYILGVFFSAMVTVVTFLIIGFVSALLPFDAINTFTLIASLGAGIAFFGLGLVTIAVGDGGVVKVLGERLRNVELGEGTFWLLPFFTGAEFVDRKQQFSDLKENEVITRDLVRMITDIDITWKIVNLFKRLNSNVKDVAGAVRSAGKSAMVSIANKYSRDELVALHNELAEGTTGRDYEAKKKLERELAEEIEEKIRIFGGEVVKVYIPTLKPNKELSDREQKVAMEEADRRAEIVQNEHFIAQVNRIVGGTGLSREMAVQAFFTQMDGKAEYKIDQKNWSMNQETRALIESVASAVIAMLGKRGN